MANNLLKDKELCDRFQSSCVYIDLHHTVHNSILYLSFYYFLYIRHLCRSEFFSSEQIFECKDNV